MVLRQREAAYGLQLSIAGIAHARQAQTLAQLGEARSRQNTPSTALPIQARADGMDSDKSDTVAVLFGAADNLPECIAGGAVAA